MGFSHPFNPIRAAITGVCALVSLTVLSGCKAEGVTISFHSQLVATAPPSVPTGLTATAGNGQIALSWGASTGGGITYTVKRSTVSGGPYSPVASISGTSHTDSGLSNGTAYYYVVSAAN